MKKQGKTFWGFVVLGGLVALVAHFMHVPGRTLLNVGLGVASLYWLLIITTVPWNLYFKARRVRHEIGVSRERGITVPERRETEVRRWERRLLKLALAGHAVTAGLVAGLTYASGHVLGYYFAAFYLLSCAIRPAAAYLSYVKAHIAGLLKETTHPRDDVLELTTQVTTLTATLQALHDATHEAQDRAFRELDDVRSDLRAADLRLREDIRLSREATEADRASLRSQIEEVERHIATVTRHFDHAVDGLTDQRELLSGIRAFVRLVRTDTAAVGE